jgi:hypothetical protein
MSTEALTKAQERLTFECELHPSGVWFVTSPHVHGLLVAKRTLAEALADLPRALAELSAADAVDNNLSKDTHE